ncbi:MAG TPA: hypothetical protein PLZ93_03445 [Nocardioides sp.]|uniref:hypothetical protein n=1 Tax=uncultured Nocardioides sp. TaxID=198441 RepID=UPI000EC73479|nr:hypothetical protein [uncultured Nocardioides sp.]HCB06417.1 hypothetical protein [Nocardioides sp.]HRD60107.1 hypothetical protein [Nocardioides sp.]HRI94646.1 hypothetical protein [Nocardioides sp.]HRK45301.1 hypothetical protein [Nocardioides sp.]
MSKFTDGFTASAKKSAGHVPVPAAKIGPEPPKKHGGNLPPASAVPSGAELPVLARPFLDRAGLERSLERAGLEAPPGTAAKLIHTAEERLAGRTLNALSDAEREALGDVLRQELARTCPGAELRQKQLREAARQGQFLELGRDEIATTTVPGGVWIFWWSPSSKGPTILGESFVPRKPGTPVPAARPSPTQAGLKGSPRWRTSSGKVSTTPPPLPKKAVVAASGLSPDALDAMPDLVFDELRRARAAALEAAEKEFKATPLRAKPGLRRAGERIATIEQFAPKVPGGEWDELTVVRGRTGPEVERMASHELDKVLPPQRDLPPEMQGMARLHVFGPIFGDETLAGLAYGPHQAANLFQKDTAEAFARWDAKRANGLNIKAGMPVKVSQYVKHRRVGGRKLPFVKTVRYDFTLESGQILTAVIDIPDTMWKVPPTGKVDFFVLPP